MVKRRSEECVSLAEFVGGSRLAEVASRAMLMIILRRNGLSIRENAACNSRVSRVLAKQMCDLLRTGIFSNRCRR
jgi:hypothetical protein